MDIWGWEGEWAISPPTTVDKEQGDWVRNPGFKGQPGRNSQAFFFFFFFSPIHPSSSSEAACNQD